MTGHRSFPHLNVFQSCSSPSWSENRSVRQLTSFSVGYTRGEDFSSDADPQIPPEKPKQLCCVRSLDPSDCWIAIEGPSSFCLPLHILFLCFNLCQSFPVPSFGLGPGLNRTSEIWGNCSVDETKSWLQRWQWSMSRAKFCSWILSARGLIQCWLWEAEPHTCTNH